MLAAYSVYNTEVGYCQGMSEIAALLLMYLNEEVKNSDIGCGISEIKIQRLREGEKKISNEWIMCGMCAAQRSERQEEESADVGDTYQSV